MRRKSFYAINAITLYRLLATPLLIVLTLNGRQQAFGIMLAVSLFTDLIDGYLARRFNVSSIFGSRFDSIADDLTFLCAIIAAFSFKLDFIMDNIIVVGILLGLYLLQTLSAFIRYHKISSFHTYLGKTAAIFQGLFLILLFLVEEPVYILFYSASAITILDLLEEIVLVFMLPKWQSNVKGIYWVLKEKRYE